jgi:toxin HigB-1
MLHAARQLNDLRAPPANGLEALTGSRHGQHFMRINDQWRICFTWTKEGPADVEIVDYHYSRGDSQPCDRPSRRGC